MAAKYQALTSAAEDKPAPPRPARGAPRPASRAQPRCCAGSTPWSSTTPAGIPPSPPAASTILAARRRRPDRRLPSRTRRGAPDLPPRGGESEPVQASGTTPWDTLGSSPLAARLFSPARLNAVGAGARTMRGQPSPLALRRARRAGRRAPVTAPPPSRRGTSACPQPGPARRASRYHSTSRSKNPNRTLLLDHQKTLQQSLDKRPLMLVSAESSSLVPCSGRGGWPAHTAAGSPFAGPGRCRRLDGDVVVGERRAGPGFDRHQGQLVQMRPFGIKKPA